MSDIYDLVSIFFNLASIILGLLGLYFVIKNWQTWQKIGVDLIKARAFLDKKFLEKNWLYLVIVGGIIMFRRIYRYLELYSTEFPGVGVIEVLFDFLGFLVILILVLMAYQWYKIIQSHI
ncbi:MAG: hypothetical protein M8349_00900 [ANME-2 cluster archaeon]|nr:hypothetical protein [ANME-2 cluster archaeon]